MSGIDTDAFISQLAGTAEPVRRLPPPWQRAAFWLAIALPPLLAVVVVHGLVEDAAQLFDDERLMIEQIATFATAITAAVAAFASTIPGASRRWLWLPAVPLAVWLASLGAGCVNDWFRLGPAAMHVTPDTDCMIPMVLIGVIPAAAMFIMLRRGAPLTPRLTLVFGALAIAALVNFGLRFFHVGDVSIMVLTWHFGLVVVLSILAALAGPRMFGWRAPAR